MPVLDSLEERAFVLEVSSRIFTRARMSLNLTSNLYIYTIIRESFVSACLKTSSFTTFFFYSKSCYLLRSDFDLFVKRRFQVDNN